MDVNNHLLLVGVNGAHVFSFKATSKFAFVVRALHVLWVVPFIGADRLVEYLHLWVEVSEVFVIVHTSLGWPPIAPLWHPYVLQLVKIP